MVKVVHFGVPSGPAVESVFSQIGKEIESTASRPEMGEAPHETIVKESIRSIRERTPFHAETPIEEPVMPSEVAQPTQATHTQKDDDGGIFPVYLKDSDVSGAEAKQVVETLVHQVFEKGLDDTIRIAKKYPPFLEDAFHDALVDRLIPELKRRGILK